MRKLTTEEFIQKAKAKHGDKWIYNKVEYIKSNKPVCIICSIHGEFWQTPNSHLRGSICPKCAGNHQYTTREFIEEANKIHNNKYVYDKTEYVHSHTKVIVTCPIHGDFEILATNHLCGDGCPLCSKSPRYNTERWKIKAREKHGDKYDYSQTDYVDNNTKVCVICHKKRQVW